MSTSPNVPDAQESYRYENTGPPRWIAILFVVLFLALVAVGFMGYSTQTKLTDSIAKSQDQTRVLSAQLEQANARLADLKAHVEVTEQKLGMTTAELAQTRSRAESIRKEQKTSDEHLTAQLGQVKQESEQKIGAVATEVGGAKKDIEATKSDLEATKTKMASAMGDMNVMSGLIARNRDDLEELKRRGDRNYYEFSIQKSKAPQRVGPVQVTLNRTDPRKSKYTVTVVVDDKTIEKKDKTSGEPVQFYVAHSRGTPYEFVVFDVGKNQITGYLSTPKEAGGAAPAAATPAATSATPSKP